MDSNTTTTQLIMLECHDPLFLFTSAKAEVDCIISNHDTRLAFSIFDHQNIRIAISSFLPKVWLGWRGVHLLYDDIGVPIERVSTAISPSSNLTELMLFRTSSR